MNKLYSYKTLSFLFFLFTLASCKQESKPKAPQHGLITEHAMVVSAREEASQIGADILKKGGTLVINVGKISFINIIYHRSNHDEEQNIETNN